MSQIGRIEDLKVHSNADTKLVVEFTEPDIFLYDRLQVYYDIRWSLSYATILDHYDTLTNKWVHNNTFGSNYAAISNSMTINLMDEPTLIGQVFYIALKPVVDGVSGKLSNVVKVYVPKRKPTQSHKTYNFNEDTTDSVEFPYFEDDKEDFAKDQSIAGLKLEILIPVVACILLLILTILCIICIRVNRKKKSEKKSNFKNDRHPSISIIQSPEPAYLPKPTSYPDHLTIGLPHLPHIDDEMMKPEYIDHDQMYDEMKNQRNYQQSYDPNNMQIANDSFRWASYLLKEHEKRQSPLETTEHSMYVDANGDLCPEIPDLPVFDHSYQNNYGYTQNTLPNYSSYRPLGSMQSVVSGTMSNDKKIRNITMV